MHRREDEPRADVGGYRIMALVKCYCGKEFENQNARKNRIKKYCSDLCRNRAPSNRESQRRSRDEAKETEGKSTAFISVSVANESYIQLGNGQVVQVRKTTEQEFRLWFEQFIEAIIARQKPNDMAKNRMLHLVEECKETEICGNSKWYFLDEINRLTPYKKSKLSMFVARERTMA
jgi:hypothetical protein